MTAATDLRDLLAGATELTIVCHNNPDPDCLASALALGRIAAAAGVDERRILYSGEISHQQNRAFVNLLDVDLATLDPESVRDREEGSLLAFVDHAVPGANNRVPEGTPVDVVIDHHPHDALDARFVDHREGVGATATILAEYVRELDVDLDGTLATALLFAIRRETLGFLRGVTRAEYDAAAFLHEAADADLLRRLASPAVSGATADAIATAIEHRTIRGSTLLSNVGRTSERDALPQAADYLATLEGVETAIVFGIVEDTVQLSARSTDSRVHVGDALGDAFADVGNAGGHREMAGGEIPLGIFADDAADGDALCDLVATVVTARLADAFGLEGVEGEEETEE
ncbi:nanoRNase/pAp phosphatase (c-di-AMP/oligoRNAs hydrolase) [Halarchaeum rubridurum]|uniref:NanoRNase/pAp phosphatase (C-di-AMP/oligoRNAs hydrolase) n=1 Tax=Halarchaeum rubridurum TaxID=489911 RepID=A0A830FZI6_9EURY|nr:bifunctional oligoribonuclease/PAP phosphatase NrnA [Halarchaeum rubridurum]MBP1953137.1 nanoRNase/pAp phosphatase (c-di-AMP/oligoRNAs hydrolase) [Halarchaeum rubridurum]GGM67576.1 phosphoesterase [Halarchaeum rubridurum]